MRLVRYFQEICMANSANDSDTAINDDTPTTNYNINRAFTLCQAVFKPLLGIKIHARSSPADIFAMWLCRFVWKWSVVTISNFSESKVSYKIHYI